MGGLCAEALRKKERRGGGGGGELWDWIFYGHVS